jgi:two-component system invasion response regulator UvrY
MTETGPPVRVLVVDDQAPFRRAARQVVDATSGFELAGEAASGEEAIDLARSLEPDLVVMDIHMPGIGGVEASRRLSGRPNGVVTVLVSTYRREDLPEAARSSPAMGYLHKEEFGPGTLGALWACRA